MCGIAGVLGAAGERQAAAAALTAMHNAMRHRGPDDEGLWHSPGGEAALSHRRLAIIDTSPAGRQPMSTPDGRLTITFNGEIYNYLELRAELERAGAAFRTRSDTEVILRAYEAWGAGCVARLRGMFALALWDERDRSCLLARDRFGIKPLYYAERAGELVFASEVRAALASGRVASRLDAGALYAYFRTGSVPEPLTLLAGLRCLEAGTYALWRGGALETHRYWELAFAAQPMAHDEAVARTRAALLDSVEHHFIADVPVGVFLSGGVDSTALVALATAAGRTGLHTLSISFPGLPNDEGEAARRTARHFGTRHEEWPVDGATGKALFARFLEAADQPSIDGLNTFTISRFAHDRGLKVVLSGLGGDELFGGYKSFTQVPRLARWSRRLQAAGLGNAAARALDHARRAQWRRLADLLREPPTLAAAHRALRGIYTHAEALALTQRYAPAAAIEGTPYAHPPEGEIAADAVSLLEFNRYMRNQLLHDSDVMAMAWGLELRVPFLDNAVVAALAPLPAQLRARPGKRLLLESVPEVPPWVAGQPKRGFLFPFERWLGDEWRDVFAGLDRGSPVPTQTWYRKWCVFVLDRWVEKTLRRVERGGPAPVAQLVHDRG